MGLLSFLSLVVAALSPGGVATDYCSDAGRMTFVVYGSRAESFTVRSDEPDEVVGPEEWVLIGGQWRRTDLPPRHQSLAPVVVIDGDRLIYSYSVVGERRESVWTKCAA